MSVLEGDVHVWGSVGSRRISITKKAPIVGSFLNQNGGGGGIRTLVTLYRPNGFRDRRIQPLCHLSVEDCDYTHFPKTGKFQNTQ